MASAAHDTVVKPPFWETVYWILIYYRSIETITISITIIIDLSVELGQLFDARNCRALKASSLLKMDAVGEQLSL